MGPLSVIVIVLLSSAWAKPTNETYSYSLAVGRGLGNSYQTQGQGHITAVRVWEKNGGHVAGLQFQFDGIWSAQVGHRTGDTIEMELRDGEAIVQISGKWHSSNYIYQVQFVTNRGRFLRAGQPTGYSFNFYPEHPDAVLLLVSGRQDGHGITSIGAHWSVIGSDSKKH